LEYWETNYITHHPIIPFLFCLFTLYGLGVLCGDIPFFIVGWRRDFYTFLNNEK